jgi:hypothetical protein
MATKFDLTKEDRVYYTAKTVPQIVELSEVSCLAIEGGGAPAGGAFTEAVQALFPFAYGVKGICKKDGRDFTVAKLEGLWWVESGRPALEVPPREWRWKLLIRLPDFVTSENVEKARSDVMKKKGIALLKDIKFEKMNEGRCIQALHIGPYADEPETIARMRKMMEENNLVENGLHHEIYLSDPGKTPRQRLKTILRQPVRSM